MIKVIYISGKIADGDRIKDNMEINTNREIGRKAALRIWLAAKNTYVICPHINSPWREGEMTFDKIIEKDLEFIKQHVDALYMLPNWVKSKGAIMEHEHAKKLGIPIYYAESDIINFANRKDTINCFICGHTRFGMKTMYGKKICSNCFSGAEYICSKLIEQERARFIPIPR